MVMNITNEEFIGVTLAIGDNYGDDIRCNDVVDVVLTRTQEVDSTN